MRIGKELARELALALSLTIAGSLLPSGVVFASQPSPSPGTAREGLTPSPEQPTCLVEGRGLNGENTGWVRFNPVACGRPNGEPITPPKGGYDFIADGTCVLDLPVELGRYPVLKPNDCFYKRDEPVN